jgi:Protein of unknown function (DUF3775)
MLTISLERLGYIIEKAREWDAAVPVDPDAASGSDAIDDDERQILLDTPDNPTAQELRDAIESLNIDEREELLALVWLGRGDYDAQSWKEALQQARDSGTAHEARYLLGTPLLADYLEEGAAALGLSLDDYDEGGR